MVSQLLAVLELERNAPVSVHPDRPLTFVLPLERVQLETGDIHALDRCRGFQVGQLHC